MVEGIFYLPENGYDNYEVEAVLNTINRELAHKYIITELMIRTLERDRQHTEAFKMKDVMDKLFEQAIRKAKDELLALKNEMGKIGLRKQDEKKLDDTVTVYYFVQRGISDELRYMNYALRNHTMKEIERLLNIK
ncbi:hypothetical protein [Solibacillus silvestris]|uniref:hypothetical protein n=1 Tax=Solibacillus silvestris TaxID=76853 RepID=UPI0013050DF3|nr:hypothetical protein [Solibacillus silvestris]